jgi:hypothetical protein
MKKIYLFFTMGYGLLAMGYGLPAHAAQREQIRPGAAAVQRTENKEAPANPSAQSNVRTARTATQPAAISRQPSAVSARSAARPEPLGRAAGASLPATARNATSARAATAARSATSARSATAARGAVPANSSRAAMTRATAVFSDVSKMGGGYAACRESYNTCMDQFCANANDTFRRCYCSDKFQTFQAKEAAFSEAKSLLQSFQDNNLEAVGLSAGEANAMYTATIGEQAIKNDVSGAASMLSQIGDLLSGKKKTASGPTGLMDLDFSSDIGDIWGGGDSFFDNNNSASLDSKSGAELYNSVDKQCTAVVSAGCDSSASFTMARSAYSILIAQDCNAYEKKITQQEVAITETVQKAEKMLRDARLEEYRSHNSASVNDCLDKVKAAVTAEIACGPDYYKCLDYSGRYINSTTGEPIYSSELLNLTKQINLNGNSDVVSANKQFGDYLEQKKMFANAALDSCRDDATMVWSEFKRQAIIEIAQAQDEAIQKIKDSCVSTMAQCYDTQSGALKSMDTTTAQASGALNAAAAKAMCKEKVDACSAIYGGLEALTKFVNAVDNVKIEEGCTQSLTNYLKETCTPKNGANAYPYDCRLMGRTSLKATLDARAKTYCADMSTDQVITDLLDNVAEEMAYVLAETCDAAGGMWVMAEYSSNPATPINVKEWSSDNKQPAFYTNVAAGSASMTNIDSWGGCKVNDARAKCLAEGENVGGDGSHATFNANTQSCEFDDAWYKWKCETSLKGVWNATTGMCRIAG